MNAATSASSHSTPSPASPHPTCPRCSGSGRVMRRAHRVLPPLILRCVLCDGRGVLRGPLCPDCGGEHSGCETCAGRGWVEACCPGCAAVLPPDDLAAPKYHRHGCAAIEALADYEATALAAAGEAS